MSHLEQLAWENVALEQAAGSPGFTHSFTHSLILTNSVKGPYRHSCPPSLLHTLWQDTPLVSCTSSSLTLTGTQFPLLLAPCLALPSIGLVMSPQLLPELTSLCALTKALGKTSLPAITSLNWNLRYRDSGFLSQYLAELMSFDPELYAKRWS